MKILMCATRLFKCLKNNTGKIIFWMLEINKVLNSCAYVNMLGVTNYSTLCQANILTAPVFFLQNYWWAVGHGLPS